MEINGKKLADGEFRQWIENERLHVVITYKFPDGQLYEEDAQFRQEPELAQEQWSWRESKGEKVQRQFAADFIAKTASVEIHTEKENRTVSDKMEIEPGRTFAGFGFTIALANLRQRLTKGEQVELKAVGFTPVPTLKPQLVTVQVSYGGNRSNENGRAILHWLSVHGSSGDTRDCKIIYPGARHKNLANQPGASRVPPMGRPDYSADRSDSTRRSYFG